MRTSVRNIPSQMGTSEIKLDEIHAERLLNTPLEEIDRLLAERHLAEFLKQVWPSIDPHPYVHGWHIDAICEHMEAVLEGEILRLAINIPPRHMKQIADSTPVITPNGWKNHGDLEIGDYVFSPSGLPVRIINKTAKSKSDMRVHFTNGVTIDCNGDHLWTVYDRCCREWKTVETRHIAKSTVKERARYQLPSRNVLQYRIKKQPVHPYFMGAWLGDGKSKAPAIIMSPEDGALVFDYIENELGYKRTATSIHERTGCVTASYWRTGIIDNLRELNVYKNKHIPDIYKYASYEQRIQLLAGLIDTDGSVDESGRVRYSTGIKQFAEDVKELVMSLGCEAHINSFVAPGYKDYVNETGKLHYMVSFYPNFGIPTILPRKKVGDTNHINRRIGIKGVTVVENPELGNCITIENPDGLYLVGKDMIPTHNSLGISVGFPAWAWLKKPELQFLFSSYASSLSIRDGVKCRRVIDSPIYQRRWGNKFKLTGDQNTKIRFDNDKGGYRICTSVDGMTTGEGGDIIIIDDANNVKEAESETTRTATNTWFDEVIQSRFNDPKTGALVSIQQRTHHADLSGHIQKKYGDAYTYLVLPAEYEVDSKRKMALRTFHGWTDPRKEEGELLWPERFGPEELGKLKLALGTYASAGQLQQRPSPREGGIVPLDKFQRYSIAPAWETWKRISLCFDTAQKEKELNDYSVCEVWVETSGGLYLVYIWRKKVAYPELKRMAKALCEEWKPHEVLIEDKGNGTALIADLKEEKKYPVIGLDPGSDSKELRMEVESTAIEAGLCWIPEHAGVVVQLKYSAKTATWLPDFEDECQQFPTSEHDDQIDPMSMYLKRVRERRQKGPTIVAPIVEEFTSESHWRDIEDGEE